MISHPTVTREQLKKLRKLKPHIWLGDLCFNWLIIVGTFWAFFALGKPWFLIPLAALIIGSRQHALGLLTHDGSHKTALPNKKWNDFFTEIFTAWPILLKVNDGYRQWHFKHHRDLGSETDPELRYRCDVVYHTPIGFPRICLLFLTDMFGLGILDQYKFFREVFPKNPLHFAGPALLWTAFLTTCVVTGSTWIYFLWLWSLLSGFWAVFRVRTWSEHVGAKGDDHSRTHRIKAGPITRFLFFPHHTYCHYEHHIWPQVPYYNLPKLRDLCDDKPVISVADLFLQFHHNVDSLQPLTRDHPNGDHLPVSSEASPKS